jgi:hypothetical protein
VPARQEIEDFQSVLQLVTVSNAESFSKGEVRVPLAWCSEDVPPRIPEPAGHGCSKRRRVKPLECSVPPGRWVADQISAEILTKPDASLVGSSSIGTGHAEGDASGKCNYTGRVPPTHNPIPHSTSIPLLALPYRQIVGIAQDKAVSLIKAGGTIITVLVVRVLRYRNCLTNEAPAVLRYLVIGV